MTSQLTELVKRKMGAKGSAREEASLLRKLYRRAKRKSERQEAICEMAQNISSNIHFIRQLSDSENRVFCLSESNRNPIKPDNQLSKHIRNVASAKAPWFPLEGLVVYRQMTEEMYDAIMAEDKEKVEALYPKFDEEQSRLYHIDMPHKFYDDYGLLKWLEETTNEKEVREK